MRSHGSTEPTDGELVVRARAGDETAFRALHERYAAQVRARVRRRMPPALRRRVAESDVMQETFTAAFGSLADFRGASEEAFGAWLARIADRKVIEAARRNIGAERRAVARELSRGLRQETGAFLAHGPSPSGLLADREREQAVARAMGRLPEDYRTILRLVHEEGLTLVEAGARMVRSAEAARKLYGRAAGRLTAELFGKEAGAHE